MMTNLLYDVLKRRAGQNFVGMEAYARASGFRYVRQDPAENGGTTMDAPPIDALEAVAEAWASIDGKLDKFLIEKAMTERTESLDGYYDGYLEDAKELISRIEARGFVLVPKDD